MSGQNRADSTKCIPISEINVFNFGECCNFKSTVSSHINVVLCAEFLGMFFESDEVMMAYIQIYE